MVGILVRRRAKRTADGLTWLRIVFLYLVRSQVFLLIALLFIAEGAGEESWYWWALLGYGTLSVGAVRLLRNRPLDATSDLRLAGSYRAKTFLGIGFAQAAVLFGFAGTLISGGLTIFLIGLGFGLAGMALIAPTAHDIQRRQERHEAAGSTRSLLDALMGPHMPGRPPNAARALSAA